MAQTPSGISEAYSGVGIPRENREDKLHPECAWYRTMGWVPRLNKEKERKNAEHHGSPFFLVTESAAPGSCHAFATKVDGPLPNFLP